MYEQQIAKELALFLLEYKAAKIDPNDPFTLASGLKSPFTATPLSYFLTLICRTIYTTSLRL